MTNVLPTNWASAPLRDLVLMTIGGDWGKDPGHKETGYSDVYCIRASEFRNWEVDRGASAALRRVKQSSLESRRLTRGDIVVEVSGGGPEQPVGRTLLIDDAALAHNPHIPKVCSNFCRLIRPSVHINPVYLNMFLGYFYRTGKISEYQGGSNNLRNLRFDDFVGISIPIPPVNEQDRIVARIEALFSEIDSGVENIVRARGQLKVYREATLKHAFAGKLTEGWRVEQGAIPSTWRSVSLGSILSHLTSGSRGWAEYYSTSGDVFVRAQNLKHDRLSRDDIAYVTLPAGKTSEGTRTRIQVGDVLITITGANVTKTGVVTTDLGTAYVSQHVALARPTPDILSEFLYWFLIAEAGGRRQLNAAAYGAGKPGLNLDNIRSVQVPLPDLDEQQRVVDGIHRLLSLADSTRVEIHRQMENVDLLRLAILHSAFGGHLVAPDSADQPATALLERIRSEKDALSGTAGKKTTRKKRKPAA